MGEKAVERWQYSDLFHEASFYVKPCSDVRHLSIEKILLFVYQITMYEVRSRG